MHTLLQVAMHNIIYSLPCFPAMLGSNLLLSIGVLGVEQLAFKAANTYFMMWGHNLFPPHTSLTITASFLDRLALSSLLSPNQVSAPHAEL